MSGLTPLRIGYTSLFPSRPHIPAQILTLPMAGMALPVPPVQPKSKGLPGSPLLRRQQLPHLQSMGHPLLPELRLQRSHLLDHRVDLLLIRFRGQHQRAEIQLLFLQIRPKVNRTLLVIDSHSGDFFRLLRGHPVLIW